MENLKISESYLLLQFLVVYQTQDSRAKQNDLREKKQL